MSATKFLQAFRRFVARRGMCQVIYSDNAKTFKAVSRELRALCSTVKDPLIQDYSSSNGIQWKFIPERAPWWGGFYERLIRSVKTALRKTLSRRIVDFIELQTLLTEIEAIINSRPITFVYSDVNEPAPLTPATIISGNRLAMRPGRQPIPSPETLRSATKSSRLLREVWNRRDENLRMVWRRWCKEYIAELRSAHHSKSARSSDLKIGDVVLVEDPNLSRLQWTMGTIEKVFPGSDGKTRVCTVKTARHSFLRRPVQRLVKIESLQ